MKDDDKLKSTIYYARYGRKLGLNRYGFIVQLIAFIAIFDGIVAAYLGPATYYASNFAARFLSTPSIDSTRFIFTDVFYAYSAGRLPTAFESGLYLAVSAVLILAIAAWKHNPVPRIFSMWLVFCLLLVFFTALYFLMFGRSFPYTLRDFSLLYMEMQCALWLVIPVALAVFLALFLFDYKAVALNVIVMAVTIVYSVLFGIVRYALFLSVLERTSYFWMSLMFFVFGPFMDFIYISAIFSFYVLFLSGAHKKSTEIWKWVS